MEVRQIEPIDRAELRATIQKWIDAHTDVDDTDGVGLLEDVLWEINAQPTLTPPNEPLPVLVNDEQGREYIDYICPRCKGIISQRRRGQRMETVYQCKFHDNCGQRVDWENQQSYRRPPEGEEDT